MTWIRWIVLLLLVGSAAAFGYVKWPGREKEKAFRTKPVVRGDVTSVVNSTGIVTPVQSVQIGAFVSGPIEKVFVDFNSVVKADEVLARIDTRTFKANVARDTATLELKKADLQRVQALADQARADEKRAVALRKINASYISDTEIDQYEANLKTQEAQVRLSKAAVDEAAGNLALSQANLEYTDIKSSVAGVVIDRKIDPGQTVAASFQTPVLFIVAPDMAEKMDVYASVDEADLGLIRKAEEEKSPVKFTVDAYPDDLFEGRIRQVRLNPTTVQNVVTYTVVVQSPNPGMKLTPGLTASLSFQIDKHQNVLKIPNAALRYFPRPNQVQPQYRKLLEGLAEESVADTGTPLTTRSAESKAAAARNRNRRHVWVLDEDSGLLAAVEVITGLSDTDFTELVSDNLKEDQELVTANAGPSFGAH